MEVYMCKRTKPNGGGWNKRQDCSNNFKRAIAHGQITDSLLSSIFGVKVQILKRCCRGTVHHATAGKRCKSVRMYPRSIINAATYIKIKVKAYLDSKMKDLKDRGLFSDDSKKREVIDDAERYKSRIIDKPESLARKLEELGEKWEKASEKLRGRYGLPIENLPLEEAI
jgi:hypothetical protein